jgi:hypothetical protein
MDETRLRTGVGRSIRLLRTRITTKRQYQSDPDIRDYITSILKASSLLERWIVDEIDDNTAIQYSESGYSNDEINVIWIHHFEQATRTRTQGRFRLLILDSFKAHTEYGSRS